MANTKINNYQQVGPTAQQIQQELEAPDSLAKKQYFAQLYEVLVQEVVLQDMAKDCLKMQVWLDMYDEALREKQKLEAESESWKREAGERPIKDLIAERKLQEMLKEMKIIQQELTSAYLRNQAIKDELLALDTKDAEKYQKFEQENRTNFAVGLSNYADSLANGGTLMNQELNQLSSGTFNVEAVYREVVAEMQQNGKDNRGDNYVQMLQDPSQVSNKQWQEILSPTPRNNRPTPQQMLERIEEKQKIELYNKIYANIAKRVGSAAPPSEIQRAAQLMTADAWNASHMKEARQKQESTFFNQLLPDLQASQASRKQLMASLTQVRGQIDSLEGRMSNIQQGMQQLNNMNVLPSPNPYNKFHPTPKPGTSTSQRKDDEEQQQQQQQNRTRPGTQYQH